MNGDGVCDNYVWIDFKHLKMTQWKLLDMAFLLLHKTTVLLSAAHVILLMDWDAICNKILYWKMVFIS